MQKQDNCSKERSTMVVAGVDFEILVGAAIAHTKVYLTDKSVNKEAAVLGLRAILKDLSAHGAPIDALKKLKVYVDSLAL